MHFKLIIEWLEDWWYGGLVIEVKLEIKKLRSELGCYHVKRFKDVKRVRRANPDFP